MNKLIEKLQVMSDVYRSIGDFNNNLLICSSKFYLSDSGKEIIKWLQETHAEKWENYYYTYSLLDFHIKQLKKFKEIEIEIALYSNKEFLNKLLVSEGVKINRLINEIYFKIQKLLTSFNIEHEQVIGFIKKHESVHRLQGLFPKFKNVDNILNFGEISQKFLEDIRPFEPKITEFAFGLANESEYFQKTYFLRTHLFLSDFYRYFFIYNCREFFAESNCYVNTCAGKITIQYNRKKPQLKLNIEDAVNIIHRHLTPEMMDASLERISLLLNDELCEEKIFWKGSIIELQAIQEVLFSNAIDINQIKMPNAFMLKHFRTENEINSETFKKSRNSTTYKEIINNTNIEHPISKVLVELKSHQ
jgi:hypothetical protein